MSDSAQEGTPVRERVERYASLRSALRALAPSTRFQGPRNLDSTLAQVRGWLREAASLGAEDPERPAREGLLAKIDSCLDILAGEVLGQLRAIPLAQLRATLPAHRDTHPDEVVALLDVCTSAPGLGFDAADLFDYLITLLATDAVDGRKRVALDPVELVPGLAARCAAAEGKATRPGSALARVLESAREELERGEPLPPIVARVRQAKRENPWNVFVPEVLRALVAYNVAAANRLEELQSAERDLDDVELLSIDAPVRRAAPAAAPEPDRGSALESEGLLAIARALQRRLAGEPLTTDGAGEIAAILDVDKLAKLELDALRDPDANPVRPALRAAVVLGLLGRRLPELRERLPRLAIDPEVARQSWVPEISARLAEAMRALVASNAYDEARRLADARNRFLTHWGEGATMPRAEGEHASSVAARVRRAKTPPAASRAAPARRGSSRARAVLYAAALALALTGAAARLWFRAPGTVEVYSGARLAAISPHLATGYRDGLGFGKVFIGTVGADFVRLPATRRDNAGRDIARSLEALGVREVLLFDAQRRLLLHWNQGGPSFPASPR